MYYIYIYIHAHTHTQKQKKVKAIRPEKEGKGQIKGNMKIINEKEERPNGGRRKKAGEMQAGISNKTEERSKEKEAKINGKP